MKTQNSKGIPYKDKVIKLALAGMLALTSLLPLAVSANSNTPPSSPPTNLPAAKPWPTPVPPAQPQVSWNS